MLEHELDEYQVGGWRGVSVAGSHGQGLCKRSVFFTDTGSFGPAPGQVLSSSRNAAPPNKGTP